MSYTKGYNQFLKESKSHTDQDVVEFLRKEISESSEWHKIENVDKPWDKGSSLGRGDVYIYKLTEELNILLIVLVHKKPGTILLPFYIQKGEDLSYIGNVFSDLGLLNFIRGSNLLNRILRKCQSNLDYFEFKNKINIESSNILDILDDVLDFGLEFEGKEEANLIKIGYGKNISGSTDLSFPKNGEYCKPRCVIDMTTNDGLEKSQISKVFDDAVSKIKKYCNIPNVSYTGFMRRPGSAKLSIIIDNF